MFPVFLLSIGEAFYTSFLIQEFLLFTKKDPINVLYSYGVSLLFYLVSNVSYFYKNKKWEKIILFKHKYGYQ